MIRRHRGKQMSKESRQSIKWNERFLREHKIKEKFKKLDNFYYDLRRNEK